MRIAICDDESIIAEDLYERIQRILKKWNVNANIDLFNNGLDLLYEIETKGIYDIIYLDIEIGDINGIELAAKLNSDEYYYTLILISQYEIYYRAAFEVQPFWFLDKPFDDGKIELSLDCYMKKNKYQNYTLDYFYEKSFHRIMVDKIMYIQSSGRIVLIYCIDGEVYKYYNKLNNVEKILKKTNCLFIRVNRSVCANMNYVSKISSKYVEMINGEIINIGIRYKEKIKEEFMEGISDKVRNYVL